MRSAHYAALAPYFFYVAYSDAPHRSDDIPMLWNSAVSTQVVMGRCNSVGDYPSYTRWNSDGSRRVRGRATRMELIRAGRLLEDSSWR